MKHLKHNQLVALADRAPFNRDSGKSSGKRTIGGGRAKVRACLYTAALTAAPCNPVIAPLFPASARPWQALQMRHRRRHAQTPPPPPIPHEK